MDRNGLQPDGGRAGVPGETSRVRSCSVEVCGLVFAGRIANHAAESRLGGAEFVQPVFFAMQVALAALWEHWGVHPDFVAAHSLGEWAASCCWPAH